MRSLAPRPTLDGLHIGVGDVSLSSPLGGYYLDLTSCLPVVESGFHGPFDERGVLMSRPGAGAPVYNTITIAQYALALHDQLLKSGASSSARLNVQLQAIVEQVEWEGEWRGFSIHRWDNAKYPSLRAPWVSALSQGNAISALLRGQQLIDDAKLLETARAMFEALDRTLEEGGVRTTDECGHLWFEEYPTRPPLHVLNGFIFALWGVLDFARATGDAKAWRWWNDGIETLRAHLVEFDCGYWSVYDLHYRELVSRHYHVNVHLPQLEALYSLTHDPLFRHYAERWRRFGASPLRRLRWWLASRLQAMRRGRRFG